jgi:predicted MFS family arabinose efflux permease
LNGFASLVYDRPFVSSPLRRGGLPRAVRVSAASIAWERWFPALAERNIRLYVFGQSVSILGTWVLDITLNLVLWERTHSPGLLGTLNFVLNMPGLLVTPLFSAGLSAANARRRTLQVLAGGFTVASILALCSAAGGLSTSGMLALALARGVRNGMEQPSRQMLLATSVRLEHIGSAVALNTTVYQAARMVGPALAALVFTHAGAGWGFAFSAAAIAMMIACVLRVRPAATGVSHQAGAATAAGDESPGGLRGALRFVRADRVGSLFMPVIVCMAACSGGYQTLVPVLADHVFGDTARWTSVFFAAAGGGALVAALLLSTRAAPWVQRRLAVPMPWSIALALLGLGLSRWPGLSLLCFAVIGFGMTAVYVGVVAALHRHVPPRSRNGLIALMLVAFNSVIALAQLPVGLLAERLGVQESFQAMGGAMLAALALLFARRWRRLGRIETDADRL